MNTEDETSPDQGPKRFYSTLPSNFGSMTPEQIDEWAEHFVRQLFQDPIPNESDQISKEPK